jgi:ABC-2 type transport system ATP-binding protein
MSAAAKHSLGGPGRQDAREPAGPFGVADLTVRFGHLTALNDVSLRALPGQVTAIVGGDGAGKSTLLRVLAHRVPADSGIIRTLPRTRIGYQPATSGVWPTLTVEENIEFVGRSYGMPAARIRERSAALLERAGLTAARRRLGHALSGGMRQKLGFVLAILHEPDLVLLDEPSTGVDPVSRVELWRLISATAGGSGASPATTVIMATTYLDEAQRSASVLALDAGRVLASGTPDEMIASVPGEIVRLDDPDAVPPAVHAARVWRRGTERHVWIPEPNGPERSPGAGPAGAVGSAGAGGSAGAVGSTGAVGSAGADDSAEDGGRRSPAGHAQNTQFAASRFSEASSPGFTAITAPDFEDALIALSLARGEDADAAEVAAADAGGAGGAADAAASATRARRPDTSIRGAHGELPTASARHITKRFGHATALRDVSLEVRPGEVVGLIGANGAGKTTLLRILLGLESADEGDVALFGAPPSNASRRRLGYVPQGLGLYTTLSVRENVAFLSRVYGVPRPELPNPLLEVRSAVVGDIGLGRERQLAFVLALAHSPELLVLDEPTSGVDPLARARLWDVIHHQADEGRAVIVTTHYLQEAEQCTRLALLSQGRMVGSGTVADLTRGAAAVLVSSGDWQRAFDALDRSGLPIMLSGRSIRVAGRGSSDALRERVAKALGGIRADIEPVPATLEETMVLLDREKPADGAASGGPAAKDAAA